MLRHVTIAAAAALLVLPSSARAQTATWEADPAHSHLGFSVRHMMISNVKGEFTRYTVKVNADASDLTRASVDVTIDAKSISTGVGKRDDHLRSADFLDVAKHPTISFRSKRIKKAGKEALRVDGELAIRGVKRPVTLEVSGLGAPVKDPMGVRRVGFQATTRINRKDFGLRWNKVLEAGGLLVGDEVRIALELELVQSRLQAKK
jgi:polyisoprenoid-binding protein YceI